MARDDPVEWIVATEEAKTLPVVDILTGRGFITGKSGSGKSNTANVIAEELLEANYNLLVVDTEGEYYALKERYEMLHVGADEYCDVQVSADHAERIATIALEQNLPIILDVSGFLDIDEAKGLIHEVIKHLFDKEKELQKPFLLLVEEIQEYLPQSGGKDDLSKFLLRIAKRGRKRGLGMVGISQRPSSVDKDYITQCNWMVWHRLSWETDLQVVSRILGDEVAEEVPELGAGEGFMMTDWDESIECVQFRKKKTFDAGATPGLENFERPDLVNVSNQLIGELVDGDGELARGTSALDASEPDAPGLDAPEPSASGPEPSTPGTGTLDATSGGEWSTPSEETDVTASAVAEDTLELPEDDDELRDLLVQQRQRNQILEDEVRELKTILQTAESAGDAGNSQNAGNRPGPSGNGRTTRLPANARTSRPERPRPPSVRPREQIDADGPVSAIVEFGFLVEHVLRSLFIRLKFAVRTAFASPESTAPSAPATSTPIRSDGDTRVTRDTLLLAGLGATALLLLLAFVWVLVLPLLG